MTDREKMAATIKDELRRLDEFESLGHDMWKEWNKTKNPRVTAKTMKRLRRLLGIP